MKIHDFDRTGLGIGGLGQNEEQFTPTAKQIGRMEKLERAAKYCRHCRQSNADGAMFTTDPDDAVCDDCF